MSLKSNLTGSFSLEDLKRMTWPIAWSGTVPVEDQRSQQTELHELAREASKQLQECYDSWEIEEGKELEIEIRNGEIGVVKVTP